MTELTDEELRKERILQVSEFLVDWWQVDEKQTEEGILKDFLFSLLVFCEDRKISIEDCIRVVSGERAQQLVDQLPKTISRNGYEYLLTIQAFKDEYGEDRWQAAYRHGLSTLDQQVGEGDMFYLALETLKDKLPDLIG